jgi:hypothetical protein
MQDKLDMIWDKPEGKVTKSLLTDQTLLSNTSTHTNKIFSAYEKTRT